ncbi:LppX_LprAFG lipoprotein [Thermogemmatispora sp.]|uniref:LppX_LprAFG lipoprotein n=1 Tax=Thermogemmatispora sp. TaxID=1968838 RepID=UPI001D9B04C8|nr:LppX_LprAFG lipoprotein [Thermogemmatispora sp.]MBX5450438.1 LppX_LprAFG lipoprotein [Thermogemmatispora sp.]
MLHCRRQRLADEPASHRTSKMKSYLPGRWPVMLVGLAIAFWLSACGGSPVPDARQLLAQAQAAMQKVQAYHFHLQVEHAGSGTGLLIQNADGDLVVPDRLQAQASASLMGSVMQVRIIVVGEKQYITDPFTGHWQTISGLPDPRVLSDSRTGIAALLGQIRNPSTPSESTIDGVTCWQISGKLDASYLRGLLGDQARAGSLLDAVVWIGQSDKLPRQIRLTGVAADGDTSQTVRTLKLSRFNETITISAPVV